ncbi:hypothetical protein OS176_10255 [Xanthomonadaceae bacterium XH05]|nr:hypothetical protein [Xanthomonadaceae bacterium XH05]
MPTIKVPMCCLSSHQSPRYVATIGDRLLIRENEIVREVILADIHPDTIFVKYAADGKSTEIPQDQVLALLQD